MNVVDFGCYLARLSRSVLSVIFLQGETWQPVVEKSGEVRQGGEIGSLALEKKPAIKSVEDNLILFESACQNRGIRTRILQNKGEPLSEVISESRFADLLLQMHYSSIGFRIFEGKASEELFKFLQEKKNLFVVMGAYGRKNQFKHSTADLLMRAVDLPIFITHKDF